MGNPITRRFDYNEKFRFYNISKYMPNRHGVTSNFCLPWASGLTDCSEMELIQIFEQVIRDNNEDGWDMWDYVIAVGDSGAVYRYYRKTINQCIPTAAEIQIEEMVKIIYSTLLNEIPLHQMLFY